MNDVKSHTMGVGKDEVIVISSNFPRTPYKCQVQLWFIRNKYYIVLILATMVAIVYGISALRMILKINRLGKIYYE